MDFGLAAAISASGMEVERARLDASAINLANVHTSRTVAGGGFKPLRVISQSGSRTFGNALDVLSGRVQGVSEVFVEEVDVPPRLVFEPGHPDADDKGFVAYPRIDSLTEMVNVMSAVRAYEANVIAMNAAKTMAMKALEIGGNV